MSVLFLTSIEELIKIGGGTDEYIDNDSNIAFRPGPTYEYIEKEPVFDRAGVTRWGGITFKGKIAVLAEGINIAPANTLDLGQVTDIITKQEATRIKTNLNLTKAAADALEGITKGEAIFQLMDVPPEQKEGKRTVIINTIILHDI